MYCFLMQDFLTIRGGSASTVVTQPDASWLDLSGFQDLVLWLDVKEVLTGGTGNVQIAVQTSPTKDDSLFVAMLGPSNLATGVSVSIFLKDTATNPLARWLRWQLTGPSTTPPWDVTFRLIVAANAPGAGAGLNRAAIAPSTRAAMLGGPGLPYQVGGLGGAGGYRPNPKGPPIPLHLLEPPAILRQAVQGTPTGTNNTLYGGKGPS